MLEGAELKRWEKIKALMDESSPELCIAILKHCIQLTLERARGSYRDAYTADLKFKALVINKAGHVYKDSIPGLEEKINAAMSAFSKWIIVGEWVADLARDALAHERRMDLARLQLERVSGDWSDAAPGAAQGWGIPGIDSDENIAKIKADRLRKEKEEAERAAAEAKQRAEERARLERKAAEALAAMGKARPSAPAPAPAMAGAAAPVQKNPEKVERGQMGGLFRS